MINKINGSDNISFNSRYLVVNNSERVPLKIYTAIYKSDAVDKFLMSGQPKTFWQHIKDFFKKDEVLTVDYARDCFPVKRFNTGDKYNRLDEVAFSFGKEGTFYAQRRKHYITAEQNGKPQLTDGVRDFGAPDETAENMIAKKIEELKDLDSLLK